MSTEIQQRNVVIDHEEAASNTVHKDDINLELNKESVKHSRLQSYVAIVTFILSVLIIGLQFYQSQSIEAVRAEIHDNQSLRNALKKPLEGVWRFKTEFSKFHTETKGKWESSGIAYFVWRPEELRYEIFMGTSIVKLGQTSESLVTLFGEGHIQANYLGIPVPDIDDDKIDDKTQSKEAFKIHFDYQGRTGIPKYSQPSFKTFTYNNCELVKSPAGRVVAIKTIFKSSKSIGKVAFTKLRQ